jgi:autotransporter translocation and assembly factor TamB
LVSLVAVGAIAGVAAVGVGLLANRTVSTKLARYALERLDAQIPADVAFEHLSITPWTGEVAVDGLDLRVPGKPDEKFAEARQVVVDLDMTALATGRVRIERLHLVNPEVTIIHRGNDEYNFQEMLPKPKPDAPQQGGSAVTLGKITLEGGRLTYRDDPRYVAAELPHLDASLDLDLPAEAVGGRVTMSRGWVRQAKLKHPLDSFRVDFAKRGPALRIDELKLDAGKTAFATRGRVDGIGTDAPKLALDGMLKADLAAYAALPPIAKLKIAGRATADFHVSGTTKEPRAAVRLTGEGLSARAVKVPKLTAALVATRRQLQLDRADATLWGGRIHAQGLAPLDRHGRLDATLDVEGIDLAAAVRALELEGQARGLTGRASARVAARGQGVDPKALLADGWVRADGAFPVKGRPLPLAARTDFRWERGALEIARLDATALGGRLTGAGRVTPLAEEPAYAFRGNLSAIDLAAVERAVQVDLPVRGHVGATIDVRGHGFERPVLAGGVEVRADGALEKGEAGNDVDVPFVASADVKLDGRALAVERLTGRVFGGTITASGRVPLENAPARMAIAARARGIDLAAVDRAYDVAPGPFGGRVDADVRLNGRSLTIAGVEARTLGGVVTASGRVALTGKAPTYDVTVTGRGVDLDAARRAWRVADVPLEGEAGARLRITGTGAAFRAEGPVHVAGRAIIPDDASPKTRRFLPLVVDGTIAATKRSVRLSPLVAKIGGSTLEARGALDLDGASDLAFRGVVTDAPAIARLFGLPAVRGGEMTLTGHASGPAGALRFDAALAAKETSFSGNRFAGATVALRGTYGRELVVDGRVAATGLETSALDFETIEAPFAYRAPARKPGDGTLRMPSIVARSGAARFTGRATYAPGSGRYDVALASQGLTAGALHALATEDAAKLPPATPITLKVAGAGTVKAPRADVDVRLGAFRHEDLELGESAVRAKVDGKTLQVDGKLFGGQASVNGRMPLAGAGNGKIELKFAQTRLAPIFALMPENVREKVELPIGGLLTGTVRVEGPLAEPRRLRASVDLTELEFAYDDLALANRGPLRLTYADRRLTFRSFHLTGGGTDVGIRGVLGLGVASDLNVEGKIDLALLEKVAPQQFADASGRAVIDGSLRGMLGDPSLAGALAIREGELETRNLPQPIRDLNASVRLSRDRIFLDQLKATLGYTGRISAFGGATLGADFMPTNVSLQVDAKEIAIRAPGVELVANADLGFTGRPGGGRLDGQVKVLEGEYTQDVDLTGGIAARRGGAPKRGGASALQNPLLRDLGLRVQVLVPDQFYVRNNLAQAELRGDLVVLGTPARPVIVGRAEALDGKVTFQDRTYTLEETTIDFIDPAKITPYVHVVASSNIQGVDVRVQANGTPEQLKLDLSSMPAMSQTDVLALIATGQTPEQLREGGGGGLATASNLLMNQVAGGVARGITDRGVVDVLRIKPGSADPNQPGGGSLTVGKRLNEKLTITYTQDIAAAPGRTPGRIMVFDYLLTDSIVLKMEQDLGGGFNAAARYRIPIR